MVSGTIFKRARSAARLLITGLVLALAAVAASVVWTHYLMVPWTRDGQVLVYVVDMAPEVSGRVVALRVADNAEVHRGDVLYEIDPVDFQIAVADAQATVNSNTADLANKKAESERRARLTTLTTSTEEQQTYRSTAEIATATLAGSISRLNQAKINLERTVIRSSVNGYVNPNYG